MLGDFNTARYTDEKLRGKALSFANLTPFNDCINVCQLMDLKHVGFKWFWHNSNVGSGRIIGRFDRVLCNHNWIDSLAASYYEYHSFATSDHAPMALRLIATANSGPKPFRYFNYWANCEGFKEVITSAWSIVVPGYSQYQVVQKLKDVKKSVED